MKRIIAICLLLSCAVAFGQKKTTTNSDPWAGTFKLDLSKSKFSGPAPSEETLTVVSSTKDSIKYSIAGKDVNGNSYTLSYDGKADAPSQETMNGQTAATITYHMTSPRELTFEAQGADGSSGTGTGSLSKDGKTITVHQKNKNPQGGEQENTITYIRQ